MRLIQWFLDWWNHFLCFPDILRETRIKLPEFGDHQTEFGGACIVRTQDSRKSILFTWTMNKSVYKSFLDELIPFIILNGHKKPSPKIWFETEHFEILSFRNPGSDFCLFTSWAWNDLREKLSSFFVNWKVYMDSTIIDEQNPEIVSKSEKFGFSTNFVSKHNFRKNQAKLAWHSAFKLR